MPEDSLEEQDELTESGESSDDDFRTAGSSMIEGWSYDREGQEIVVSFRSGQQHSYPCSPEVWEEAKNAASPGRFVHQHFL